MRNSLITIFISVFFLAGCLSGGGSTGTASTSPKDQDQTQVTPIGDLPGPSGDATGVQGRNPIVANVFVRHVGEGEQASLRFLNKIKSILFASVSPGLLVPGDGLPVHELLVLFKDDGGNNTFNLYTHAQLPDIPEIGTKKSDLPEGKLVDQSNVVFSAVAAAFGNEIYVAVRILPAETFTVAQEDPMFKKLLANAIRWFSFPLSEEIADKSEFVRIGFEILMYGGDYPYMRLALTESNGNRMRIISVVEVYMAVGATFNDQGMVFTIAGTWLDPEPVAQWIAYFRHVKPPPFPGSVYAAGLKVRVPFCFYGPAGTFLKLGPPQSYEDFIKSSGSFMNGLIPTEEIWKQTNTDLAFPASPGIYNGFAFFAKSTGGGLGNPDDYLAYMEAMQEYTDNMNAPPPTTTMPPPGTTMPSGTTTWVSP